MMKLAKVIPIPKSSIREGDDFLERSRRELVIHLCRMALNHDAQFSTTEVVREELWVDHLGNNAPKIYADFLELRYSIRIEPGSAL